jgi:hypothetical protein
MGGGAPFDEEDGVADMDRPKTGFEGVGGGAAASGIKPFTGEECWCFRVALVADGGGGGGGLGGEGETTSDTDSSRRPLLCWVVLFCW